MKRIVLLVLSVFLFVCSFDQRAYLKEFNVLSDTAFTQKMLGLLRSDTNEVLRLGTEFCQSFYSKGDTVKGIYQYLFTTQCRLVKKNVRTA